MAATLALVLFSCAALLLLRGVECAPAPPLDSWVQLGKADADHEISLTVAIARTNPGWLDRKLRAVSYPDSLHYGEYMNFDEIAHYVRGRPDSLLALEQALGSVGVGQDSLNYTIGRDFAVVRMRVSAAEKLFNADFYEFKHVEKPGWYTVKSLAFTLPPTLVGHVDFVFGVADFPRPNRVITRRYTAVPGQLGVTPDSIAKDYNTSGYVSTSPANSQAIAGFLKQYFDPSDLEKFQKRYNLPIKPISKVVGTNDPSHPGDEAVLDVEYISSTGRNVSTWFVSISTYANKGQEDFLAWIVGQVNDTGSPWVHSASYGDDEDTIDASYLMRMEDEFKKFGVSGRTVLFASGDNGVHCKIIGREYQPDWPTSSPSVTAVGGASSLDTVWSDGGGGFSDVFPTPDYQAAAVKAYLDSGQAPSSKDYNSSGRAYPDVAAFSVNFNIILDGFDTIVAGTSCAAPTFAGIVASLNDIRLRNGQKTLGFLNPFLYQTLKGHGFTDITKGSNNGGNPFCGFKAIAGWDPASGWGNPNFGLLKTLLPS